MTQYIDKSEIVAEIKRMRDKAFPQSDWNSGYVKACESIISFLDTIEVKEVDLNKENKNLKMLLDVIDYSFLQTDGSYDKSLTYPVIDKVLFIKKNII